MVLFCLFEVYKILGFGNQDSFKKKIINKENIYFHDSPQIYYENAQYIC